MSKRRTSVKKKMTFALAASIFALTLGAFPHHASAADQAKTTTSTPTGGTKGEGSDQEHKDWIALSNVLAPALSVLSSVLPL
jgi:hypothetical protein